MPSNIQARKSILSHFLSIGICAESKGQSMVEFTLIFVLLLVVAWIPADFGLAFYTGQMALNAARDGARIAAADRNPAASSGSCTMPCSGVTDIRGDIAKRMSTALMPGATITLAVDGGTACDRQVRVTISGQYRYFFYQVLRLMGVASAGNPVNINRQANMRWEHQC
jgi:Flp pilus assembly protein TadG